MLNNLSHIAQVCYAQYSLNAQHCAIVHMCINFSLFEQLCTICSSCVVHKVKNCATNEKFHNNLHNANESCAVLSIVQVFCA